MKFLRALLIPFGWLYGSILAVRNRLYDSEILKTYKAPVPVICIGNLQVGGTGKTPHTEYLAGWLSKRNQVAILSRGYKRHTSGYLKAGPGSTANDIGDEPLQMSRKLPGVTVAVCEKRAEGIQRLLQENPKPSVIVLDDAMQHRAVSPTLTILLSEFERPYYEDRMMPAGRLREFYTGEKRADVIIFTKCPTPFSDIKKIEFIRKLDPYDHQEIYFTTYKYGQMKRVGSEELFTGKLSENNVLLLTGIANPEPLKQHLLPLCKSLTMMSFPDHYHFTAQDIRNIAAQYNKIPGNSIIITTEKDSMRLGAFAGDPGFSGLPLWYIPVEVSFLFDEEAKFKSRILEILK